MADHGNGPFVDKVLSKRSFLIDDVVLDDYYNGLELPRPASGRLPATIASDPDNGYFNEIAFSNHFGHLWMRQEWKFFVALTHGKRYTVSGQIREIYKRRDRSVVRYEVELTDASGQLALRTQHHQSFLPDRDPSGEVEFRKPSAKPGARRFVIPEGEAFGGLRRTISLRMCGKYFHGDANYHTDRDASKELGFRDVVVGGRMTQAYASHILEEVFQDAWWNTGELDVKFTNPVWAGDTVTARGVITGPLPDDATRIGAFVWLAKEDGTIALVANASVEQ